MPDAPKPMKPNSFRTQPWLCGLILLFYLLAFSPAANAANRALLVGVSRYPALPPALQLQGPANDMRLMRNLLQTTGFAEQDIRVLADDVPGATAAPTRSAILRELKALGDKAGEGDFIYLQFSGHGSQQPSRPDKPIPETDGLDEIFLPSDIGAWDGAAQSVTNAIADDEIGAAIDAIRQRGAFVWAVFDSCHSGGITRGGEVAHGGVRQRQIKPADLGIPSAELQRAARQASPAVATRGGTTARPGGALGTQRSTARGGFVFFYAAQPDETTDELDLPQDAADQRPMGLFTFTLAQVIAANPGISYRQAAERILQIYAAQGIRQNLTPLFEGSALDAHLFGQTAGDALRQWRLTNKDGTLLMPAGSLQQIGEGALLGIYPNVLASDDKIIGYLRATQVGLMESRLAPLAHQGKPALAVSAIPPEAVVRIADPALRLTLKLALPASTATSCQAAHRLVEAIRKQPPTGVNIEWQPAEGAADLRLICADSQLWLASPDGLIVATEPGKTPSLKLDTDNSTLFAAFAESLQRIARARNLARLAVWGGNGNFGNKIDASLTVIHKQGGSREELHGETLPTLEAGDRLELRIENIGSKPVDLTVLSVDSRYGIDLIYPLNQGELNRLGAQESLKVPPLEMDGTTAGREGLVIIAVEARPGTPPADLAFLAQTALPATRGSCSGSMECFLMDAASGTSTTRGEERRTNMERLTVKMFNWQSLPSKQGPTP